MAFFGIWAILLGRKPEGKTSEAERGKWAYENIVDKERTRLFLVCFFFLAYSVLLLELTALGLHSPVWFLFVTTASFMLNAAFLALTLYFDKFKS